MAELTSFSYQVGRSLAHGLDARFKLLFLVLISLASLKAGLWALLFLCGGLWWILSDLRLPLVAVLRELRYFLFLLIVVFAARALATPGEAVFTSALITITREGLVDGVLVCWRLLLIVLLGLLLTATTRPSEIRAAVEWILKPIPAVPAKRIGTMMGLIMRFIPVILNQVRETAEAQRARGVENRENPLYRLTKLGIPLIRRTFENADRLITAMEARCYSENRTGPELKSTPRDWIALLVIIALGLSMIFI
ncbi:MAG: energy-coupling factor transporter transmembrane component T [Desulfobacterales bacterium]|nr:energy-coupling factor transporter transmembrane component T [Desulfobacterales bacterium]